MVNFSKVFVRCSQEIKILLGQLRRRDAIVATNQKVGGHFEARCLVAKVHLSLGTSQKAKNHSSGRDSTTVRLRPWAFA